MAVIQATRSPEEVYGNARSLIFILALVGLGAVSMSASGGLRLPTSHAPRKRHLRQAARVHRRRLPRAEAPLTVSRTDAKVLQRGMTAPEDRELVDDLLGETSRRTRCSPSSSWPGSMRAI